MVLSCNTSRVFEQLNTVYANEIFNYYVITAVVLLRHISLFKYNNQKTYKIDSLVNDVISVEFKIITKTTMI